MAAPLFTTESGRLYHAGQILVSCVGLPARGKTHIARSLLRYLRWLGVKSEVFSLGDYRRKRLGHPSTLPSDYFSTGKRSAESEALRDQVKREMMDIIGRYYSEGGQVAIYDANNTTIAERGYLREWCTKSNVNIMFIETICSDAVVEKNIRAVKLQSPDYRGWDPEKAVKDYWNRIQIQAKAYEPIEQPSFPYVKVLDVGDRIVVNNINGYLQSRVVFFLMNIHNKYRHIYFARSGASYAEHSYKADAGLSEVGETYATSLRDFLLRKRAKDREDPEEKARQRRLVVWTSSRRRCVGTSKPFLERGYKVIERAQMTEINPGIVDGLSRHEIRALYPEEYEKSIKEPYSHRFPRGESYHDLSVRLEPNIFELERDRNDLLIVSHGSVLRCLFAYLKGLAPKDIPKVMIERGDLVEITPSAYGVTSKTYTFWRPPEGHEDSLMEPGTQPGVYGSPVSPSAGLQAMQHAQNQMLVKSPPNTPMGDSAVLSDATPRLQHLTLKNNHKDFVDSRPASATGVPTAIRTPYYIDAAPKGPDGHIQRDVDPGHHEHLQADEEQGDDPDLDGNPDNSCEWAQAKPLLIQQTKPREFS